MLRGLSGLCAAAGIAAQISMENRMACGTGACMGCADFVAGRPQRVCVEGPVFDSAEVFE
jgi:dihydroorotate dehydrogenase electron transfer subunit